MSDDNGETFESKVKAGAVPPVDVHELKKLHGKGWGLNFLRDAMHENAVEHGWWGEPGDVIPQDGRFIGEKLMLIVTEVAEVMEEYRVHGHIPGGFAYYEPDGKPEGIPAELADVFIRLLDLCGALDIDIERAVLEKHNYNVTRPFRHGGKLA